MRLDWRPVVFPGRGRANLASRKVPGAREAWSPSAWLVSPRMICKRGPQCRQTHPGPCRSPGGQSEYEILIRYEKRTSADWAVYHMEMRAVKKSFASLKFSRIFHSPICSRVSGSSCVYRSSVRSCDLDHRTKIVVPIAREA